LQEKEEEFSSVIKVGRTQLRMPFPLLWDKSLVHGLRLYLETRGGFKSGGAAKAG
jgi:fumarate hydratase class II